MSQEEILKAYLERLMLLQDKNEKISQRQLEQIASELGMSSELVQQAQALAQDKLTQGKNHLAYNNIEEAYAALQEAFALSPTDLPIKYHYAQALAGMFERTHQREFLAKAEQLLNACIEEKPTWKEPFALLARLKQQNKGEPTVARVNTNAGQSLPIAAATWLAIGGAVLIIGGIWFTLQSSQQQNYKELREIKQRTMEKIQKEVEEPQLTKVNVLPSQWAKEDELVFEEVDNTLATEMIVGKTDGFETSRYLTLQITNQTGKTIRLLEINLHEYDDQGNFLLKKPVIVVSEKDQLLPNNAKRQKKINYKVVANANNYRVEVTKIVFEKK
ncbi:MAG TPA: hypothetical protein DCM08_09825 [Microscillaceae bacterium]|nr:hypothetical protein [Microscillaceae bacterium]